jgi:hypothetical protein
MQLSSPRLYFRINQHNSLRPLLKGLAFAHGGCRVFRRSRDCFRTFGFGLVPKGGLEPPRVAPYAPQTYVSTSSTTSALLTSLPETVSPERVQYPNSIVPQPATGLSQATSTLPEANRWVSHPEVSQPERSAARQTGLSAALPQELTHRQEV